MGQKGIESIPLKFHKKLKYPTKFSTHIKKIESYNQEYFLLTDNKKFGPYDFVFTCIPFEQSKDLLESFIDYENIPTPN